MLVLPATHGGSLGSVQYPSRYPPSLAFIPLAKGSGLSCVIREICSEGTWLYYILILTLT